MIDRAPEASRPGALPRLEPEAALEVSIGQYSSAGNKAENQDFHGALVPGGADRLVKGISLAIADGISTSRLGATAAETAVKGFLTDYYATSPAWSVRTSGERVLAATNSWMHAQNARQRPREEGEDRERAALVCTFSAVVLKGRSAHVFHVGDARVSLIAQGSTEPLTELHRVDLGGGRSYLGRALGADRTVEIDYRLVPVQPGHILMLATDGIHEHVPAEELAAIIGRGDDLDGAAHALAEAALARGSDDNLTVQLVRVERLPHGDVAEMLGEELALPAAPHLRPGQSFEGFRVLRELHAGSRSHVYLARDETSDQRVVLKVPATEHAGNQEELAALLLEQWVARRVTHPALLPPAPVRSSPRHIYAVAPFIEGETLEQWMHDHPQAPLVQVRSIIGQLAAGLLALHRREMIHRDLRPRNVIVEEGGTARIIDFGSVEVAGLGELASNAAKAAIFAGSIQYTAPEILRGDRASPQSDLFSLGVIAYQMLTGDLPYGAAAARATTIAAQRRLRYRPAPELNPAVPDWLDAALARAVAIDPARRYSELSEFTYDLAHPNPALERSARPLLERGTARQWRIVAMMLAAALILSMLRWPELG
jgi:serine/threonine protein phosphatase PrpC